MTEGDLKRVREDEYQALYRFAASLNGVTYPEFDEYTMQRASLFVVPKDEHFRAIEQALDKIARALPALKRIFTKPITRLKDVQSILPVEAVRVINNRSMSHVSAHSELWGDVTDEGLKPRKLMTVDREEDYAIYENVAFCRLIGLILAFTRRNARLLKDIMYAYRDLQFNLLERANHPSYYLAIGKLHMGYARAQDKYDPAYERCLEKLLFIDKTIREKLRAPVYAHCRKKAKEKLVLKKTNVFRLHKDYRQVYALLKWFGEGEAEIDEALLLGKTDKDAYAAYCSMLAVFAVGHFNFAFDKTERLQLLRLNTTATFMGWRLTLERVEEGGLIGLRFGFTKEKNYRICLLFGNEEAPMSALNAFKRACSADEYFLASCFETATEGTERVHLSLFDVDSFRRLQQLLLRGMVYADETRTVCPFCGKPLSRAGEEGVTFECRACRTQIFEFICPETGEKYVATGIKDLRPTKRKDVGADRKTAFLVDKYAEARLYYRNVTPVTADGRPMCPRCGKAHKGT